MWSDFLPTGFLQQSLLGLLLVAASFSIAEEPAGSSEALVQEESGQDVSDMDKAAESASDESFTPSEKISEDLSVSFPVDI
ncbi:MAG: hypothetical protein QF483_00985 [Gammaproteobacteria bacterium]|jgi:hypothetical protein|nr:hypothetical protein [Chromatiales bacterium]MCP4926217.1 hypothetical protein [Gammaproteobacteria bacterium]MDP7153223.1 hypothetical protein [Gammaproteobacteria bacterium]MDP7296823.1 hypothetical protein [Gammaproteobacteria bacterium]MDP7418437.1 hypothetical protein [Gammaproteobacteria bacterium]